MFLRGTVDARGTRVTSKMENPFTAKMHEAMQGHDKQIKITDIMELIGSFVKR
jgi:hypothetical protein